MNYKEVCLLNDSFPPLIDGVSNTVVNYARVINNNGHQVSVVVPDYPGADDSLFPYPVIRYPSIDLRELIGYTAGFPFDINTMLDLKKRNISILHSHCPAMSNIMARSLRESLNVPIVLTYHTKFDIDIANATKLKTIQAGAIKALVDSVSSCDELWAVSEGAGRNIQKLGYNGDFVVMENGVDIPKRRLGAEEIAGYVKDYDLPADVPVFLFVGRLMWYKGLRIILDALAALKSQDFDFRMVIIGGGSDEKEIRNYNSELKLDDKVIFTGPIRDREELSAWYCRADLFLFPSTFDTNGLVVREAAASSLASVLVKGSCAAENVTNNVNSLLIDENAASLAVCLAKVLNNKEYLRKLGANASDDLYLSWDEAILRAMKRYEIVIDNYKSGKYKRNKQLSDGLFTLSGDLLDFLAAAEEHRHNIEEKVELYW